MTSPKQDEKLDEILGEVFSFGGLPRDKRIAKAKEAIRRHIQKEVSKAEQKPVGDAIEIQVPPETMQAVMSKIKLKDKTVADRVLEPEWRVKKWRDGTADKYEVYIWKLRLLAHLTRRFNWTAFLLKPDNLEVITGKALQNSQKGKE